MPFSIIFAKNSNDFLSTPINYIGNGALALVNFGMFNIMTKLALKALGYSTQSKMIPKAPVTMVQLTATSAATVILALIAGKWREK